MKINFLNYSTNQTVDKSTTAKSTTGRAETNTQGSRINSGYTLDISGKVMDNKAYGGQGKTAEDVMQDAKRQDVVWQKNYMAVMSNSMSDEEFAKLQEGDFNPGSTEIETVVTIVDQIKANMALAGIEVAGFTDDIDAAVLEDIVGDSGLAQDIQNSFRQYRVPMTPENITETKKMAEEAEKIEELSDGAKKYLVTNQMEPTADNLYKAQYSAAADGNKQGKGYYQEETNGYYAKKAEDIAWEQLEPQIQKIIQEAGLGSSDTETGVAAFEESKWLIEKGIPLTANNLKRYHKIESLELPLEQKKVVDAAARALADGGRPSGADLTQDSTLLDQAVKIYEKFQDTDHFAGVDITAKRQAEEVRLQMTVQANLLLLKSGYAIDTAPLEELVQKLKAAEAELNSRLFGESDLKIAGQKADLYTETMQKMSALPVMPAAAVGKIADSLQQTTINTVYEAGSSLQQAYAKAEESYETLMTVPRKDLGDSIRKAFGNIDDILQDLNLEASEQNRRAVRILAYNSTPITEENLMNVKAADQTLRNVIEKMTPSATLQMIREGRNPLTMSIPEMEDYLSKQKDNPQEETEKYSKFLYKLEKNQEITPEEKDAFIGIYRLIRQVEKSDGAVIGNLLEQGAELNFKNLLSAVRSSKKTGTDVRIDDDFGTITQVNSMGKDISDQIMQGYSDTKNEYYNQLMDEIYRNLTPESLKNTELGESVNLEQFAEALKNSKAEKKSDDLYQKEQLHNLRNLHFKDESALKELLDYKQPVTLDNLLAADMLLGKRGSLFQQIYDKSESGSKSKEELKKAAKQLTENFNNADAAAGAYEDILAVSQDILEEAAAQPDSTYLDLRGMNLLHKQLSLAGNLSKEESYEIPVEVDGQMSSIRLTIVHDEKENGKVTVTYETPEQGKVAALFRLEEGKVSGYILCSGSEAAEAMKSRQEKMEDHLKNSGFESSCLQIIQGDEIDINSFGKTDKGRKATSSELYQVAKSFLQTL